MKQFSALLGLLLMAAVAVAQTNSPAISACTFGDNGLQITLDESQICAVDGKDALEGLDSLGYHSGINGFMNVIAWNDAGHVVAVPSDTNSNVYIVTIDDIGAYYGVDASTITQVDFVFNQGPSVDVTQVSEWDNEGKAEEAGACADFVATLEGLETCATTSLRNELKHLSLRIAPNPMSDRALVSFHNLNSDVFRVQLISTNGQVVRTYSEVRGNQLSIEKAELANGLYFVNFTNQEGQRASTTLMVN